MRILILPSFLLLLAAFAPCCVAQTDSLPAASPEKVWQVVEEMPAHRGGRTAWEQYLRHNLRYYDAARRAGVTGNVYAGFIVCEDGSRGAGTRALRVANKIFPKP